MPSPKTPPTTDLLEDILAAINSLNIAVQGQTEDIERIANFQRYMAESFYGANADIAGIWDATDRYAE